jgi:hypothetical protein
MHLLADIESDINTKVGQTVPLSYPKAMAIRV